MSTAPLAHRNRPPGPCHRCRLRTGEYRWQAASRAAERVQPELRLCSICLQALNLMLCGYENKLRQKSEAAMAKSQGATS
jgi:hypothetical protein